ncbi:caspase family protein [Streptosporangiaceae bacterium NEAU-GS5]|nr:caspase family protein [Streptosporangiaceae bacterium NEAU-GS5]
MLSVAVGSGGVGIALARALIAWLNSRRADVSIRVTTDAGTVHLDARRVKDPMPLLERCCAPMSRPDPADWSTSRAVLIGVSAYQDPGFPDIPAASNSLQAMHAILADPRLCGWDADRITVLRDPPDSRRVAVQLRRLAQETRDVLLVYYVGHGTITSAGELVLTLVDTEAAVADV